MRDIKIFRYCCLSESAYAAAAAAMVKGISYPFQRVSCLIRETTRSTAFYVTSLHRLPATTDKKLKQNMKLIAVLIYVVIL